MAGGKKNKKGDKGADNRRIVADNRKARHDFFFEEVLEAGIALSGTEVKSLREGRANIAESYASEEDNEIWLINSHIPQYSAGNRNNHEPRRHRKLLLHRREIDRLLGAVQRKGMTLVPLKLYFNDRGIVKLELALAKGKKLHDKRQAAKDRDWARQKARIMREKG
jgi:SsrA-binding protein